ncbi:MAG: TIGR02611 family protein [Kineosporiaceae bacterium]|jgi:uncharacterized protein (TIGR02611 family)
MSTVSDESAASQRAIHPLLRRPHAWRERIRRRRSTRVAWKVVTGLVGTAVTVAGLIMVPFPGPGWLVVIVGLVILASEFAWAQRLLHVVRHRVRTWTDWIRRQSLPVRIGVGLLTAAFVGAVLYGMAVVVGIPGFVPDGLVPPLPGL